MYSFHTYLFSFPLTARTRELLTELISTHIRIFIYTHAHFYSAHFSQHTIHTHHFTCTLLQTRKHKHTLAHTRTHTRTHTNTRTHPRTHTPPPPPHPPTPPATVRGHQVRSGFTGLSAGTSCRKVSEKWPPGRGCTISLGGSTPPCQNGRFDS